MFVPVSEHVRGHAMPKKAEKQIALINTKVETEAQKEETPAKKMGKQSGTQMAVYIAPKKEGDYWIEFEKRLNPKGELVPSKQLGHEGLKMISFFLPQDIMEKLNDLQNHSDVGTHKKNPTVIALLEYAFKKLEEESEKLVVKIS